MGICLRSAAVGAGLGVNAGVGDAKALDGTPIDEVFFDDFGGVFGLHKAVPDRLRVDHDGGPMLALVEAERLVNAHAGESGSLGELLQLRKDFALAVGGTRGAGSALGANVMTDKDMMLVKRQSIILL
jgi:hypothetical protein